MKELKEKFLNEELVYKHIKKENPKNTVEVFISDDCKEEYEQRVEELDEEIILEKDWVIVGDFGYIVIEE